MGKILDSLIGNIDTLDNVEPKSLDYTNSNINPNIPVIDFKIAEINSKSDMLTVNSCIKNGDILIIQIQELQQGLSKREVLNYLHDSVKQVNGDIVQKNNLEYIITPTKINIHRSKL